MKPVSQSDTTPQGGDCFRACVASILELPLEEVPHFCAARHEGKDWWEGFQAWLDARGLVAVQLMYGDDPDVTPTVGLGAITTGTPVILGGQSAHGPWFHSIVGVAVWKDRFEYVHDPNPAGGDIVGPVRQLTFFAALRPDHAVRRLA